MLEECKMTTLTFCYQPDHWNYWGNLVECQYKNFQL